MNNSPKLSQVYWWEGKDGEQFKFDVYKKRDREVRHLGEGVYIVADFVGVVGGANSRWQLVEIEQGGGEALVNALLMAESGCSDSYVHFHKEACAKTRTDIVRDIKRRFGLS